jgi:hypothetical protein
MHDEGRGERGGREGRKKKLGKIADFFPNFDLNFLLAQCLEFTSIFKGGKGHFVSFGDQSWP